MINIKSTDFLPGLYKPFKEGQLTEEKPYQFINGGYEENLTKSGWDALKKFAVKPAKTQAKAPSMPAMAIMTLALKISGRRCAKV